MVICTKIMDIRNLLQGKELSVCLFKDFATFTFISLGVEPNISVWRDGIFRFPRKKTSVTLPYKVKLNIPKDSNLPPNDTTRWQQPSCYFIPFNVLSSAETWTRISALKGPRSNQLIYGTIVVWTIAISIFRLKLTWSKLSKCSVIDLNYRPSSCKGAALPLR